MPSSGSRTVTWTSGSKFFKKDEFLVIFFPSLSAVTIVPLRFVTTLRGNEGARMPSLGPRTVTWTSGSNFLTPWLPALQIGIPQDTEANVT